MVTKVRPEKAMKSILKTTSSFLVTLIAFSALPSARAATSTWDGGDGASASWVIGNNWVGDAVPLFDNQTDLVWYASGAGRLAGNQNAMVADRIIRSLTFGAEADADVGLRLTTGSGGTVGRTLFFEADAGNAALNVDSDASGNFTIGFAGPGTGNSVQVSLTSQLDVNHSGSGLLHINKTIGGAGALQKNGAGTFRLSAANEYAGGTILTAGYLEVANAAALGSGSVALSGANRAVLRLESGITVANTITFSNTNAASAVEVVVASGAAFRVGTSGTLQSSFAGGQADTTVRILGGSNSSVSNTTLLMSFADSSTAGNDSIRMSDVLNLTGTGSDIFVLELGVADVSAGQFLGWLDTDSGTWLNAITENSATGLLAEQNFAGSFAASGASATADYLGSWGYDTSANTVWAVLDHNSAFAVVPEPGASLLFGLGAAFIFWRKRRRSDSLL